MIRLLGGVLFFVLLNGKETFAQGREQTSRNVYFHPFDSAGYVPYIIPDYFILGTLSDYMGRSQYVNERDQVDKYYPYERPLLDFLVKYAEKTLLLALDTSHLKSYSAKLAKQLNCFYGADEILIYDLFTTREQVYSYLTGVYYRYGIKLSGSYYKIERSNSFQNHITTQLLQSAFSTKIYFHYLHDHIPVIGKFYFDAPPKLIKYFNWIEDEKKILDESFLDLFAGSQKLRKALLKSREEENRKCVLLFD